MGRTGLKKDVTLAWVVVFILFVLISEAFSASRQKQSATLGLRLGPPSTQVCAPLFKEKYAGLKQISSNHPYLQNHLQGLKREFKIDSTRSHVTVSESLLGTWFRIPRFIPFKDYLSLGISHQNQNLWQEAVHDQIFGKRLEKQGGKGIGFEIPIPIKSQAFQKIFGGASVGLKVVGNISIDGGLRHEKRSEVKTAINRQSDYNFKMKQTQRFTVKGNVGKKVNVYVDQDSERPFEFDNAIRLEYKGFEDEIVKSIKAGNIALSLPATQFVTFSGKNSGLFGIKAKAQIGNLNITAIASQEKGQKKKLSIQGGATEDENKIQDYQYRKGTYFFLNDFYRNNYKNVNSDGIHEYNPDRVISKIELYKSDVRYESKPGSLPGWAIADINGTHPENPDTNTVDQQHYRGYFLRIDPTDYYIDRELGYIALNSPLREGEVLAAAYRDTSGAEVGDIHYVNNDPNKRIILQLIRPKNPRPSDSTWKLEWRNVYFLGSRNINKEGFDLKIFYKPPSGDPQETETINGKPVSYLQIFGLDKRDLNGNPKPDNILDDDPNIINWARGELIFPSLTPFAPEKTENSLLDSEKYVRAIYDTTDYQYITSKSNFYISVKAKIRQPNYNLGFNVIENSEEITLNGRRLVKGTDYIIDYFSGSLTILDEAATDPNASLNITYESNQLFQINRKTLLGMRWDYQLFNDSFIGGTFLYLNQSTIDQKIRLGQNGPMTNFVWDLNSKLNFNPNFLTKAVNALPIVQTREPSTLKFEGEMAQVIPNPNKQNNPKTGDNDGVAYVDDFEGSKRETPLGIMRRAWHPSSVPASIPDFFGYDALPDSLKNTSRGHLIWYNPYQQVAIKEIWPDRDVNPNVPQRVHVLSMEFNPRAVNGDPNKKIYSWNGVEQALSAGYADQSQSKYLEIWVKGDTGRIHIDFGQISEDAIPNLRLDTEDKKVNGIRNDILDDNEDVGLDGMLGADPPDWPHPHEEAHVVTVNGVKKGVPYDFWDLNNDGIKEPYEPWSYDNWNYSQEKFYDYRHINGTENNKNDEGGRFPDTEDLNQNGDVDLQNSYFEFTFSLDKSSPDTTLIAGGKGNEHGWRMYRIPLQDPTMKVGSPQWTNIEYVRIWVDHFSKPGFLSIAEINLVGSDWKEKGVAATDSSEYDAKNDTTVAVTVINTHDNPEYVAPHGVEGVRDRITQVQQKEQALVLKVTDLEPGNNGIAQKTFFKGQSFIDYNKLKMFVYGKDPFATHMTKDSTKIEFFFQFGSDENNYYEFREKVYPHWDKRNEMIIDFEDLTGLKLDSSRVDLYGNLIRIIGGKQYRIVGKPTLTNIRQITVGVKNLDRDQPFTGEIWLDELRLVNVKKNKGIAMRMRGDLRLADVASVNASLTKKTADFHTVNERFGKGNNSIRASVNGSLQLHKFLPKFLGLSIPLSFGYNTGQATPKYYPGSDILVTPKTVSDSLLETIQSRNKRINWSISIQRGKKSLNPFLRYTVDAMSMRFSNAQTEMSNSTTKKSTGKTSTGDFSYSVSFPTKKGIKLFSWLGNGPIVNKLSNVNMILWPSRFNYKITGNRADNFSELRNGLTTPKYSFVVNQNLGIGFQPLRSISLDFTQSRTRDLYNVKNPAEILNGQFGEMTGLSQQVNSKFNPKLFSWLATNFSGGINFRWNNNIQNRKTGQNASSSSNLNSSLTLTPKNLLRVFLGKSSRRRGFSTVRRRRPRSTARQKPNESKEKKSEEKKEKSKKKLGIPILKWIGLAGSKINPISIRMSRRADSRVVGLSGMPTLDYQLGRTYNPGVQTVDAVGSNRSSFNFSNDMSLSSGLKLSRNITIQLKYAYNNSKNRTTRATGSISQTIWKMGEKEMAIPDWTFRWSGLEKLPIFKKFAKRVSLDHARSGRKVMKWNDKVDNKSSVQTSVNYRPLIGLTMTLKKEINVSLQVNSSMSENFSYAGGLDATRKINTDISLTTTYRHSGGLKIPIPFLKKKEIRNNIDFSMGFNYSKNKTLWKRGERGKYVERTRMGKWSITPKVSYSFSSTVRGGLHFEYGQTDNKLMGKTTIQDFGINVNISIAGR